MDLLQPYLAAAIRPAHPIQGSDRAPRAVTPAGESFGSRLAEDRKPEDATPHGPPATLAPPARPMFFSLLSDGTQTMLRQMFTRGLSYRIDDAAPSRNDAAPTVANEAANEAGDPSVGQRRGSTVDSFTIRNDGQILDGSFASLLRRATFAYAQGLSASPGFPFARPAETMNMVA